MSLLIAGTGALACLFASRLAASGVNVTMLGSWPEGLKALRQHGVHLLDLDGEVKQQQVEVIEAGAGQGNFDLCFVLVKSWQTERTARQLAGILPADGIALTLQNGLGNYETLGNSLGSSRVVLGVTTIGARMLEPGYVQYTGEGRISLENHPSSGDIAELIKQAGLQVEIISDPVSLLWGKLVINAAINPLTALLRVANGELLERPAAHELLREAASEAAAVAVKKGITLPYNDALEAVEQVARNTSANISSMLQDVTRGTKTEIEAINGAIVSVGAELDVPTPLNHLLWQLVRSLDQR